MMVLSGAYETVTLWSWYPDPVVVFTVVAAGWFYWKLASSWRLRIEGSAPIERWRVWCLAIALAAVVLALLSPLGVLADDYLLSMHMLQHVLLTLVAPPLLLVALPPWFYAWLARRFPTPWSVWRRLTNPFVAFVLFHLPYSVWHVPVLYNGILESEPLHILAHQIFIATALLVWWPLVAPGPAYGQLPHGLRMIYLFVQTLPGQVVGAMITLADHPLYERYELAPRVWNLGVMTDQEIGGLIMWVATGTFYLLAIAVVFFRWASREDARERERWATAKARTTG